MKVLSLQEAINLSKFTCRIDAFIEVGNKLADWLGCEYRHCAKEEQDVENGKRDEQGCDLRLHGSLAQDSDG